MRVKKNSIRDQLIQAGIIKSSDGSTTTGPRIREAKPAIPLSVAAQSPPADKPTAKKQGVVTAGKSHGLGVSTWLYAALKDLHPKGKTSIEEGDGGSAPGAMPRVVNVSDDEMNQILLDNPNISAATFLNMLKSKGFVVSKAEKSVEADAASSNVAVQRESASVAAATGNLSIRAHFREASAKDNGIGPTRFSVVLIQEGLGNLRDGFFYTKEALKNAIPVFEGKKIYADHPSAIDEQARPERSVRDILGHFEGIKYEENATGQGELIGDVVIMADKPFEWARGLMRHAVEFAKKFPDKEFVGLSINASGDADQAPIEEVLKEAGEAVAMKLRTAMEQGLEVVKKVSRITEAISCDLVTEAGAGGKIKAMIESDMGEPGKHGPKWDRCVQHVKDKQGGEDQPVNPYAACTAALGTQKEKGMKVKKEGEAAADAGHADVAQDKALIKKMLDEYVGKGEGEEDHPEEMYQAAHEAFGAAKGDGMNEEEAMKCAGHAMRMAKILNAKKAKEAECGESEAEAQESESESDKKESEAKEAETKESAKKIKALEAKVTKLEGENAGLKDKLGTLELADAIDAMLRESKLPMAATKKFRESIKDLKTKSEVEARFKAFREGYELSRGGEANSDFGLSVQPEKGATLVESESDGNTIGDFGDCVEN